MVTPETGSAFELDQVYRDGFFLVVALEEDSALDPWAGTETPLL